MTISRDEMQRLIDTNRAQPWTHTLGPNRAVAAAARVEGRWHIQREPDGPYEPAPGDLADTLDTADRALSAAAAAAARADTVDPTGLPRG